MERGRPDRSGQRDDAFWIRIAIGGLIGVLLIYGCWQALTWFAAHFPKDFR